MHARSLAARETHLSSRRLSPASRRRCASRVTPYGSPDAWQSGHLFVGEHGSILSDYSNHVLLPKEKFADFKRPDPYIPSSIVHHREWIEAIKTGAGVKSTTCNFDYSGALTEAVLLGVVSYKSGRRLEWDAKNLEVTNTPEAQQLVHKEYRRG